MPSIAVIDYGMGNLRSVSKALEHVAPHAEVIVTSDPAVVRRVDRVVFPGQGAMPDCMREMEARGLRPAILEAAATKPFLGICIGLQMLFDRSEEGDTPGLGIVAGRVARFPAAMRGPDGSRLKVPHMGWNEVDAALPTHPIWAGIPSRSRFYFVHSFCVEPVDASVTIGRTEYGIVFTAAIARSNIIAVQFHPEKSHAAGLRLLANFVSWQP
jgi:imidazole glycerol-phosphate synthase subunit HisH